MSLLGDAVSVLPVIGSGAQTVKVAAKISKYIKPLLKFANYYGIGTAASTAIKRAAEGKPLTIQDLRVIAVGLAGGINSYKMGVKNGTKKVEGDVTLKNTDKNFKETENFVLKGGKDAQGRNLPATETQIAKIKDLTFSKEEVAKFNEVKDPAERLARVREAVIKKGKEAGLTGTDDAIYSIYKPSVDEYFTQTTSFSATNPGPATKNPID